MLKFLKELNAIAMSLKFVSFGIIICTSLAVANGAKTPNVLLLLGEFDYKNFLFETITIRNFHLQPTMVVLKVELTWIKLFKPRTLTPSHEGVLYLIKLSCLSALVPRAELQFSLVSHLTKMECMGCTRLRTILTRLTRYKVCRRFFERTA